MRNHSDLVHVLEEGVMGYTVGGLGAYYTTVKYIKDGMEYEVLLENEEFEILEELIEHDD